MQPIEHGDAVQIRPLPKLSLTAIRPCATLILSASGQKMKTGERFSEMKRSRQEAAAHRRDPAAGFNPIELAIKMNAIFDAQPLVEIDQVRAAAQQHVLAVVDCRAVFIGSIQRIRSSPATEKRPRLKNRDGTAGRRNGQRGGEACETASYNRNLRLTRNRQLRARATAALA